MFYDLQGGAHAPPLKAARMQPCNRASNCLGVTKKSPRVKTSLREFESSRDFVSFFYLRNTVTDNCKRCGAGLP